MLDFFILISRGKRFVRLFVCLLFSLLFLLLFALLAGLTIFDNQHNNIIHDYVARNDDIIVLSTTFFENSQSFPPNTAVILFNSVQVFHLKHSTLNVIAETFDGNKEIKFEIHPVINKLPFFCKWVPYLAIGQVPEDPVLLKLSTNGKDGMELSLRNPYRTSHNVVACFSPMFLNERWQLLLSTVEVYSHYGAFLHFYVRSMITDLFDLVKSNKNVKINAWPSLKMGNYRAASPTFNPNTELEFRNQASAMTDCLLLYKDSAKFIMFPDPDDFIIPTLGRTYKEEFIKMFEMFPTAGALAFNMTQTEIESTTSPFRYSPLSLLSSIKFKGEQRWGKLVVRPEKVDSVWIHKTYGLKKGYEQKTVPIQLNSALHFRFWNFTERPKNRSAPFYDPTLSLQENRTVFKLSDGLRIEKKFKNHIRNNYQIFSRLPSVSLYYPLIESCYNRIFYEKTNIGTCKGPEYCNIPPFIGLRCTNVASEFVTYKSYKNVFIHQLVSAEFEESENGCTL
ncbi:unnamed protein product [Caenorhabditis angaria]|uniref:Glycosyltransferase family 92 protein n=1 Tax=Caenorhabditis angaria TaxID=860376 RepID=A0A9P1I4H3_9PELO|nr:unnamed protein product [Caenorhabditis angaria]